MRSTSTPKYKLLAQAVIDGVLREAGEIIEYEGEPGPHMELVEGSAPAPEEKPADDPDMANAPPPPARRK